MKSDRDWIFVSLLALALASTPAAAELVGIDFGPPGNTPANWTSVSAAGSYQYLTNDDGQSTRVSLYVSRAGTPYSVSPNPATVPVYKGSSRTLAGIDGNQYQFGGSFEAEISGLKPVEPYQIYLFGLRGGAGLIQGVSLTGGRSLPFSQQGPDGVLVINDQPGSDKRELSSYAMTLTSSRNGTISMNLTGGSRANQTFAIAGLAIEGAFPGSTSDVASETAAAPASATPPTNPPARSTPVGPDVIGLYLGMPFAEASLVLADVYPEITLKRFDWLLAQVQESRISGGPRYEAGFQGSYNSRDRNEQILVTTHMPPNNDRIAGIARYTFTGEMLLTDLRASLVQKYGEPHLEIQPGSVLGRPYLLYSWSLGRDGQPLKDPVAVVNCVYQQTNNPWEGSAPVTLWDTREARNGIYDACGLVFAVGALPGNQMPPTSRGFGVVLYDMNEIRKTARQTWEDTDRMATQLEQDKEKALSGKKPLL